MCARWWTHQPPTWATGRRSGVISTRRTGCTRLRARGFAPQAWGLEVSISNQGRNPHESKATGGGTDARLGRRLGGVQQQQGDDAHDEGAGRDDYDRQHGGGTDDVDYRGPDDHDQSEYGAQQQRDGPDNRNGIQTE